MDKVIILTTSGNIDISGFVTSVSWSGDINTLPRKIEVEFKNTDSLQATKKLVNYEVGNPVVLYYKDKEIFRGFIFNSTIDHQGNDSFVAYDNLVYVTKNMDSIIIKNKTTTEVINDHINRFGLTAGTIESTFYKIPKLVCQKTNLSDIWLECLKFEKANTGKSFFIYSDQGAINMVSRENAAVETVSIDNVISSNLEISIDDLRTQVMIEKGDFDIKGKDKKKDPYVTVTVTDNEGVKKYGYMQHIDDAWEKATISDMRNIANTVLATLNKPTVSSRVEFIGDIRCITGRKIEINDRMTGISGIYYITSDSHTYSDGVYKMSLQLSKNLE